MRATETASRWTVVGSRRAERKVAAAVAAMGGAVPQRADAGFGVPSTHVAGAVACIPAFNEEKTLGDVIAVVRGVAQIERVVVISDGSTDRTAEIARQCGAVCIELQQNVGKGGALKLGIAQADAEVYLFLDADLIGLTPQHVRDLLDPVLQGEAQMTLGILEHGRVATDLAHVVAPYLSGQRAVTKAVLQGVSGMETARYGIEVAINRHLRKHRVPVRLVPMENLTHRTKEEKLGLLRGFVARLRMYWEIVKYAGEAANPFGE